MSPVTEKLSEEISMGNGFRVRTRQSIFDKITSLEKRTNLTRSYIIRAGLERLWPQIEEMILAQAGSAETISPEERRALADFRRLTGADPCVYLRDAARQHLAARPSPLPAMPGHD